MASRSCTHPRRRRGRRLINGRRAHGRHPRVDRRTAARRHLQGPATFDAAPAPLKCDVIPVDAFEEALLLREEGAEKRPLVVSVHGGPHSCTPIGCLFRGAGVPGLTGLRRAIDVNYRGSPTGFGKSVVRFPTW